MKRFLYVKFVIAYLILGILGFFIISTLGSKMIENKLVDITGQKLYQEANSIATNQAGRYYMQQVTIDNLYENLVTISTYQNAQIWLISTDGEILINTKEELDKQNPTVMEKFDPSIVTPNYYRVTDFYGQFSSKVLSVMVPVTRNMSIRGYIAIHHSMSDLYEERETILGQVYLVYLLLFVIFFSILALFSFSVYRPLRKITEGANQYAAGNLTYNIPVASNDEMGYLASTLNYMSGELAKSGDYQRNFIANVSHDFRSPLTSIKGYTEAMLDGTIPVEMQDKYLNIILFETERLNKLTKGLLTLNNMDTKGRLLDITNFDIISIIKNTAATFEGTCRSKKISIELIFCEPALMVSADMGQIQQVLYNLIDNAIKFSHKDSSIYVETTEKHGKIFISVKDTGIGIPKESVGKVFDRFYKIDTSRGKDRKGTGLGLAIVKEIISAHNQNINVISTPDVGTEFIFTLDKAK